MNTIKNPYIGVFPFLTTACLDSLANGAFEAKFEKTKAITYLGEHRFAKDAVIVTTAALVSYPSEVVWRRMVLLGGRGGIR